MLFKLEVRCDNAAFHDPAPNFELARILARVSHDLDNGIERGGIRDENGNLVGSYSLEDEA